MRERFMFTEAYLGEIFRGVRQATRGCGIKKGGSEMCFEWKDFDESIIFKTKLLQLNKHSFARISFPKF